MGHENQLGQLFKSTNHRKFYPKGSIIILQGSAIDEVHLIIKGLVSVYSIDNSGNQHTVSLLSEDNIMPASWLLRDIGKDGAIFFYQAVIDTSCYSLHHDEILNYMRENVETCFKLLDILTKSYINSTARIRTLQRSNVIEKIDFILYYIAQLYGNNVLDGGIIEINAPITHQEIADLAGLTRESISRQMSKPKYQKILQTRRGKTYIDLSSLDVQSMPKVYTLKI
jgi:CRP/FNR family cyclic AMP-dependent transcriptional regulator